MRECVVVLGVRSLFHADTPYGVACASRFCLQSSLLLRPRRSMSLFLCATAVSGYTLGAGGALQGRVATQSRFSEASRVAAEPLMGMSVDLTGKTAFVAGVADSTGYGWAICKVHRASPRSVSRRGRPLRLVGGSLTLLGTPTHRQRLDVIWTEPGSVLPPAAGARQRRLQDHRRHLAARARHLPKVARLGQV